jgi:ABC-2 type transport system ATP-binding protein
MSGLSWRSLAIVRAGALVVSSSFTVRLATSGGASVEVVAPGEAAAAHWIVRHELTPLQASLEQAFMELTREELEYKSVTAVEQEEAAA